MINIQTLVNRDGFILYQIPAGKPDPKLECKLEDLKNDTRGRVKQQSYKENTCWYYALNMIRERIGQHPSDEVLSKRKIEKVCSERRKQVTLYEASLPGIFDQLPSLKSLFDSWNHPKVRQVLSQWDILYAPLLENEQTLEGRPSLRFTLQNFLSQNEYKNLYDYMWHVKLSGRAKINEEFFKNTGHQASDLYREAQLLDAVNYKAVFGTKKWEELDAIEQDALSDRYAMHVSAELYELQKSSWRPPRSAQVLMKEIREKGPLVIGGIFGKPNYSKDPHEMKKIEGRSVFVWSKGERKDDAAFAHAITVVGVEIKNEHALVYYVDPVDLSDPLNKHAQKIYAISYRSLQENTINLGATWLGEETESPTGYAWAAKQFKVID